MVLRRLGYMPGSVMAERSATDTTRLTVAMSHAVQTLATVAVNEKAMSKSPMLAAFERRRLLGSGSSRSSTRDDIDRLRPTHLSDVIRTIPSVTLTMDGNKPIPMNRRGVPGPWTVPMEYRSARRSSGCGLSMIWTRRSG
jgi:outer membrane receptor for ferrienterochelin and colicin